MIPDDTIDQVRQASDIVQVVGEYVRLKKRGRNYLGLCPFHTEKTPSFSVSPDKQIFHCFGCGKGGNVFTFLIEHEGMSFVDAVKHLARRSNITIPEDRQSDFRRELREKIAYANQVALEYFSKTLRLSRYHSVLESYLKGRRNISAEAIEYFQLGLAGEQWDGLINYASSRDLTPDDLLQSGLALKSEQKANYFDRFRQRLMIPIFNLSQKPIAFGGRTLKKGEAAKYVNSPETPLYVKGNGLYNLNFAKDAIREANAAIIVEGYFDVISLWQIGVRNVVASSGTAFTPQQARLLARFAEDVYLFFDADSAGQNAAARSVDALYDAGLEVKVMVPPEGEDPDSVANKYGFDKIDELQGNAQGFIPYRVRSLDVSSMGIIGKEKLVKELAALGYKIADPTRRGLFFEEAAGVLGVNVSVLREGAPPATSETSVKRPPKRYNPDEFDFVSLLFNNPGSIDSILQSVSPDDLDSRELSRLYAAVANQYKARGVVDAKALLDGMQDPEFISLVTEVASREWEPDEVEAKTKRALEAIVVDKRRRIRTRLRDELAAAEAAGDQDAADRLLKELRSFGLDADRT